MSFGQHAHIYFSYIARNGIAESQDTYIYSVLGDAVKQFSKVAEPIYTLSSRI